jgi:hypothetical protein
MIRLIADSLGERIHHAIRGFLGHRVQQASQHASRLKFQTKVDTAALFAQGFERPQAV